MKKGILCVLVMLAISLTNWSYGQWPTSGGLVLSDITTGGNSSSNQSCIAHKTLGSIYIGGSGFNRRMSLYAKATVIDNSGLSPVILVTRTLLYPTNYCFELSNQFNYTNTGSVCQNPGSILSYNAETACNPSTGYTSKFVIAASSNQVSWNLSGNNCPC